VFNLANLDIVAWPTAVPDFERTDHKTGGSLMVTVDVRYRIFTRAELREIDTKRAVAIEKIAAKRFADIASAPQPDGANKEAVDEFHRKRAEQLEALTVEVLSQRAEAEAERAARLVGRPASDGAEAQPQRVLAFRMSEGEEWQELSPDTLARLLNREPYLKAFEEGLFAASRGARAKN
jgi:hypothetical protein